MASPFSCYSQNGEWNPFGGSVLFPAARFKQFIYLFIFLLEDSGLGAVSGC